MLSLFDFIIGIYSAIRTKCFPIEVGFYPDTEMTSIANDLFEAIKDEYTVSSHDDFSVYYKLIDFVWVEISLSTFEEEVKEKFLAIEDSRKDYQKELAQRRKIITSSIPELIKLIFNTKK